MNRLVVIGDALLDVDTVGSCERLCPGTPAPVVEVTDRRARPGGAALAAVLAAGQGVPVRLVTALGGAAGARVEAMCADQDVEVVDLGREAPTPVKNRVLTGNRVLVRIDEHGGGRPTRHPERLVEALQDASGVLVADYGQGVVDDRLRALLEPLLSRTVWDPHPTGGPPRTGVAVAVPNLDEAHQALGTGSSPNGNDDPTVAIAHAVETAGRLVTRWRTRAVVVTVGPSGAVLMDRSGTPVLCPGTPVADPVDTCGAGDAFASTLAAGLAAGRTVGDAFPHAVATAGAFVAAGAAGAWRPGTSVTQPATATTSGGRGGTPPASGSAGPEHPADPVVVATSGCFDLLHAGHVQFLDAARRLGDRLVVLVNSDESVRRLKGRGRPLQTVTDRIAVLRSLSAVDDVIVFDEDTPLTALDALRPALFVKGGDYTLAQMPEADVVSGWGGVAATLPYLSGHSTTRLLEDAHDLTRN